ncbi:MAG: hypothetical protein P4L35_01985 [Ignavibacteriaceae bacterium]|nr:hypothetical protein [Ignavibacteriaceae bacterium]
MKTIYKITPADTINNGGKAIPRTAEITIMATSLPELIIFPVFNLRYLLLHQPFLMKNIHSPTNIATINNGGIAIPIAPAINIINHITLPGLGLLIIFPILILFH